MSAPRRPLATIAAALRRERERAGLSLTELARRAGHRQVDAVPARGRHRQPQRGDALVARASRSDVPFSRLVEPPAPRCG